MTDSEYAKQRKRITALARKWIGPLGLKWWRIDLVVTRESFRDVPSHAEPHEITARCHADWPYGIATIEFDGSVIAHKTDETLERVFVHELCHVFLSEMHEQGESYHKHEERVATMLEKAFLWLRDDVERECAKQRKRKLSKQIR